MSELKAHLPASYNLSYAEIQAKATAGQLDKGRIYQTTESIPRFYMAKSTTIVVEVFQGEDKNEVFIQNTAAAEWNITHSLNKRPSVTVIDSAGTVVEGTTTYISNSEITLTFTAPFSGKAYLN